MKKKDFLLKLTPEWHALIAEKASTQQITMTQVICTALQDSLNLPPSIQQPQYRARPTTKKYNTPKKESLASRVPLAVDLPRWMDIVMKAAAKQRNWSISSLVCVVLYKKIKGFPTEPPISKFTETMVKRIPLSEAPSKYYLRASIPADWMPVIKEYATSNGQKVSHVVRDALLESLGKLKETAIKQHEKEIAQLA